MVDWYWIPITALTGIVATGWFLRLWIIGPMLEELRRREP